MYAIFENGSFQYRVQPGDTIDLDLLDLPEGQQTVEFERVLLVGDGANVRIGRPLVEGAKVVAKALEQIKGRKIHVYKFKRRKGYEVKTGHRQRYLRVQIEQIVAP